MCKVFAQYRLWERAQSGEFRYEIQSTRKEQPLIDHRGRVCTWNDELFILDDMYSEDKHQHDVARAHRYRTDDDTIGGSGLWDPKEIMLQDVNYRIFSTKKGRPPTCELCEADDMIPPWKRHYGAKYRPSVWRWIEQRLQQHWNRFRAMRP